MFDTIRRWPRASLAVLGIFCFAAVGSAVTVGSLMGMTACAMCWFQRLSFLLAGTGFVLSSLGKRAQIVTLRIAELGLLLGLESSMRQTYLLAHPNEASGSCAAGLFYYLQIDDYKGFFSAGMLGGVDCAENQPFFLGLQLPQWSLVAFIIVTVLYAGWWFARCRKA